MVSLQDKFFVLLLYKHLLLFYMLYRIGCEPVHMEVYMHLLFGGLLLGQLPYMLRLYCGLILLNLKLLGLGPFLNSIKDENLFLDQTEEKKEEGGRG